MVFGEVQNGSYERFIPKFQNVFRKSGNGAHQQWTNIESGFLISKKEMQHGKPILNLATDHHVIERLPRETMQGNFSSKTYYTKVFSTRETEARKGRTRTRKTGELRSTRLSDIGYWIYTRPSLLWVVSSLPLYTEDWTFTFKATGCRCEEQKNHHLYKD